MTDTANQKNEEAWRRFTNAEADKERVKMMKREIAEILADACTQALSQRGVRASDRLNKEIAALIEREI